MLPSQEKVEELIHEQSKELPSAKFLVLPGRTPKTFDVLVKLDKPNRRWIKRPTPPI